MRRTAWCVLASFVVACGADGGEVELAVASAGLSEADVSQVLVEVTGPGIDDPIELELARRGTEFRGIVGGIPAGADRTFSAEAYDAGGVLIYTGAVSGVTITRGSRAAVLIVLQQANAPAPYRNGAPVIDGFVASAAEVGVTEGVLLTVTAHDPDGSPLTYVWETSDGTFSDASSASTHWTAPGTEGVQTTTVRVTDAAGATAAMSFAVNVTSGRGAAGITARFNSWPAVTQVMASPTRIDAGETTTLAASAGDDDGDALAYAWNSTCAGTFGSPTSASTTFTLGAVPESGECVLHVDVSDGRGGASSGEVTIAAGPAPDPEVAPVIVQSFESTDVVDPGEAVSLHVIAEDADGQPLTFTWTASAGTITDQTDVGGRSDVTWNVPGGCIEGLFVVNARATDTTGLWADVTFTFVPATPVSCCMSRPFGALRPVGAGATTISGDELAAYSYGRNTDAPSSCFDFYAVFRSTRASREVAFGAGAMIDGPTRTCGLHSFRPFVTPDELALYFLRDVGGWTTIHRVTRASTSATFGSLERITAVDGGSRHEDTPFVAGSGLYFARRTLATDSPFHLWRAPISGASVGAPTELTEIVSGSADDQHPVVTGDELTMYFRSTRPGGPGGTDVWMVRRDSTGSPWGAAQPVAELSSPDSEQPVWTSADGCRVYVSVLTGAAPGLYVADR